MEPHLSVDLVPAWSPDDSGSATDRVFDGWTATIGGGDFPIRDFQVGADDAGRPVLSLVLSPDSIRVGTPVEPAPLPPVAPPVVVSWGDGSQPDPRESIPGWTPESMGRQVAGHAERVALRGVSPMAWLRRLGGEGGTVVVTA